MNNDDLTIKEKVIMILIVWLIGVLFYFLLVLPCSAQEIDINAIIQIESSGNPLAYNKRSQARGLMQITPICLDDYNGNGGVIFSVRTEELFDPKINIMIGKWYLNYRIPQMLNYYGYPDTIENRLIAYNAGISFVVKGWALPKETRDYIKKYRKLTE